MDGWFLAFCAAAVLLAAVLVLFFITVRRYRKHIVRVDPDGREVYVACAVPELAKKAGFSVERLPHSAVLAPNSCWLVDGCTAEIGYSIAPDQSARLRVAPSGKLVCADACRGISCDQSGEYWVDDVLVTQRQVTGGYTELRWSRGGYDCLFYAQAPQMGALGGLAAALVPGLRVIGSQDTAKAK